MTDTLDTSRTAAALHDIVFEAGELALRFFKRADLDVEAKGYLDPVTEADLAVEQLLHERLRGAFPDDGIVGEEGATAASSSGRYWVIDPIDGTFNFVRGMDQWSVSVGLFEAGRASLGAVYQPTVGKLTRGPGASDLLRLVHEAGFAARFSGCGSSSLMSVILGQADGYLSLGESSWDMLGGVAILSELGGRSLMPWTAADLQSRRVFACGSDPFMAAVGPILAQVGSPVSAS